MDINISPIANNYNLNTSHPLQVDPNSYINYPKYVTISSMDRDLLSYPKSSEFEIELPQALENVSAVSLYSWDFPANYEVFTPERNNLYLRFTIVEPYIPIGTVSLLDEAIYNCLEMNKTTILTISITKGFYTQYQMVTELTNKLNKEISDILAIYIQNHNSDGKYNSLLPINDDSYDRFVVIYNAVKQNIWFGNRADKFILNNLSIFED